MAEDRSQRIGLRRLAFQFLDISSHVRRATRQNWELQSGSRSGVGKSEPAAESRQERLKRKPEAAGLV
jgi:hypothetical protein